MKRIIVVVGVVLGLGAIGLSAAHADSTGFSTWCTDGVGGGTNVPNGFVGLSVETSPTDWYVCYSTTPNGSSNPEAAGGAIHVAKSSSGDYWADCFGDRATSQTVVVECHAALDTTDPTSAPGSTASAAVRVGTTGPVPVGQTGAEVGNPATSLTTSGPRPSASAGVGSGTCTWVNGTTSCPLGGFTIAGVTVNEADLIPTVTPYTPTPPCTGINNTCIPVGATVKAGQDTSNPTLRVNTAASGSPTDVDTGPQCVQVNATC